MDVGPGPSGADEHGQGTDQLAADNGNADQPDPPCAAAPERRRRRQQRPHLAQDSEHQSQPHDDERQRHHDKLGGRRDAQLPARIHDPGRACCVLAAGTAANGETDRKAHPRMGPSGQHHHDHHPRGHQNSEAQHVKQPQKDDTTPPRRFRSHYPSYTTAPDRPSRTEKRYGDHEESPAKRRPSSRTTCGTVQPTSGKQSWCHFQKSTAPGSWGSTGGGGGSTANLLALWRTHHLDEILRECWEAGVVLAGVSAGKLCWHLGGTTDSFGLELQPITDGLGLLPYSNCPHYDAEDQRRPLYHRLVGDGTLPAGYATDNGAGLHYVGTELVRVVTEVDGAAAYHVEPGEHQPIETRLEATLVR